MTTDTDRIAALEREVAELRRYIQKMKTTGTEPIFGTGTLSLEYQQCPMCGTRNPIGTWHICASTLINTGGTS